MLDAHDGQPGIDGVCGDGLGYPAEGHPFHQTKLSIAMTEADDKIYQKNTHTQYRYYTNVRIDPQQVHDRKTDQQAHAAYAQVADVLSLQAAELNRLVNGLVDIIYGMIHTK